MQQWMVMQGRLLTPDGMTSYLLMSLRHLALCLLFAVIKGTRNKHWSLRYLGLVRPRRKFCTDGPSDNLPSLTFGGMHKVREQIL